MFFFFFLLLLCSPTPSPPLVLPRTSGPDGLAKALLPGTGTGTPPPHSLGPLGRCARPRLDLGGSRPTGLEWFSPSFTYFGAGKYPARSGFLLLTLYSPSSYSSSVPPSFAFPAFSAFCLWRHPVRDLAQRPRAASGSSFPSGRAGAGRKPCAGDLRPAWTARWRLALRRRRRVGGGVGRR